MGKCTIEGCSKRSVARGWCAMHYRRWKKHGDVSVVLQVQMHGASLSERFFANTEKADGCWRWVGYQDPNGYGRLNIGGTPALAHRISWALFNGEITSDQHVCHHCDNPQCVNPDHLFLGDAEMNTADKMAKKRHRFGISRGVKHGQAKLTERMVREIRKAKGASHVIAKRYGVASRTVRQIRTRETWKHLE